MDTVPPAEYDFDKQCHNCGFSTNGHQELQNCKQSLTELPKQQFIEVNIVMANGTKAKKQKPPVQNDYPMLQTTKSVVSKYACHKQQQRHSRLADNRGNRNSRLQGSSLDRVSMEPTEHTKKTDLRYPIRCRQSSESEERVIIRVNKKSGRYSSLRNSDVSSHSCDIRTDNIQYQQKLSVPQKSHVSSPSNFRKNETSCVSCSQPSGVTVNYCEWSAEHGRKTNKFTTSQQTDCFHKNTMPVNSNGTASLLQSTPQLSTTKLQPLANRKTKSSKKQKPNPSLRENRSKPAYTWSAPFILERQKSSKCRRKRRRHRRTQDYSSTHTNLFGDLSYFALESSEEI
jgi:hypothetical protein